MVVSFRDAVANGVVGTLCATLAVSESTYRLFSYAIFDPEERLNISKAVRRQLCNIDPEDDIEPVPAQFTGGQCDGVIYTVSSFLRTDNFTSSSCANSNVSEASGAYGPTVIGPISSIRMVLDTPGSCGPRRFRVIATGRDGDVTLSQATNTFGRRESNTFISNITVARADGLPDICGNPDPIYPDPEPVEGPVTNITYNVDESTEITVPLAVVFAPIFIDLNGNFSFPINVDVGGVNFNGTVTVSPQIEVNIKPTGGGGGGGGTDDFDDDITVPITPEEEETPEFDQRIIGVFVRAAVDINQATATLLPIGSLLPPIWAPRLGSVKFLIRVGETNGWTPDIDIKNQQCYIPCPHPGGAVDVRAAAGGGVSLSLAPHRAVPLLVPPEPEPPEED